MNKAQRLAMGLLLASASAVAADLPAGKPVFDRYCAECHAPGFGHPGTMRLEQTRGRPLSVLQERKDLTAPYVMTVVRNGYLEMPAYRITEIDDVALAALAAYLAPGKVRATHH